MHGMAFTNLVHGLIREYGQYSNNDYSVDVNHFNLTDKRLVLSHLESAEWYEWACQSETRTSELFNENKKYLQRLIDGDSHEVYREDMEEMRAYK